MRIPLAILGATGTVGQKMLMMLHNHPLFEVAELAASEKSAGQLYGDIVLWREEDELPSEYSSQKLISLQQVKSPYALSALPADIAREIEPYLAQQGIHVISNASPFRMDPLVPLCIPEINSAHLELIHQQKTSGKIITNPNCSTVFAALALAPLHQKFKIKKVSVVTLQALSGAGYPGVPASDILGNLIPHIPGEEEKIETEIGKILNSPQSPCDYPIMAHVHRVPILHGHTICLHIDIEEQTQTEQIQQIFAQLEKEQPELYKLHTREDRPRPLSDLHRYDQRVHIGRIKVHQKTIGLISMGHNLVRGAAGAALVNLEKVFELLNR